MGVEFGVDAEVEFGVDAGRAGVGAAQARGIFVLRCFGDLSRRRCSVFGFASLLGGG